MENLAILLPVVLSFFILMMPSGMRYYFSLAVTCIIVLITSVPAFNVLMNPQSPPMTFVAGGFTGTITFTLDSLSAFFLLVTNFTMLTGMLYSKGYLQPYQAVKSPAQIALHNFSFVWLHLSMTGVLLFRDGLAFLIAWELMAVSSFMLILFEAEKRATLKTAVNYLIQMHVGLVILVIAFLICEFQSGEMSFDALIQCFSKRPDTGLFFLFFAGFAVKAGFVPFHTWLPEAHPAAPTHVSGVMSGVMIKMGIYGIIRVLTYVQSDRYTIGIIIVIISVVTGLFGIMMAILQTDLKRLLAYSTIENIGIIGLGIGIGTMGLGLNNPMITLLGFGGGLLHAMNHSLFKSLLFYSTGSVYTTTHSRNIEQLGGLIHKMPMTAGLFLFGSIAICALPPLNGFISEILIYYGLFLGLQTGTVYQSISLLLSILALALIGGLSLIAFSKAFGLSFLGNPRSEMHPKEVTPGMIFPKMLIAGVILLAGLVPMLFFAPVAGMVKSMFHLDSKAIPASLFITLSRISQVSLILILLVAILIWIRSRVLKTRLVEKGPTWGCGYTAPSAHQQYTATSFAANFSELANPVLNSQDDYKPIPEEDIFAGQQSFVRVQADIFRKGINRITDFSMLVLKKIARLQTGNIQHYILYAFIFILIIFVLLYLNIL